MKVFTGRSNPELGKGIADYLGIPLGQLDIQTFSDGEISVAFEENIRYLLFPSLNGLNGKLWKLNYFHQQEHLHPLLIVEKMARDETLMHLLSLSPKKWT